MKHIYAHNTTETFALVFHVIHLRIQEKRKKEKMTLQLFLALILLIYVQISIVPYVNGASCTYSIPTITSVKKCPVNEIEWEREKERKQCHLIIQNCTNAEKFQYHCLPDKFIDTFVEVCAPILQTVGHYCPYYDLESKEIQLNYKQPCNEHSSPCPDFYFSNVVHKYQGCYNKSLNKMKTKENDSGNVFSKDIEEPLCQDKECYQKSKTKKETKGNDFRSIVTEVTLLRNGIFAICILLATLVVLAILQIFCPQRCRKLPERFRRRNNNRKNNENHGEELVQLNPNRK